MAGAGGSSGGYPGRTATDHAKRNMPNLREFTVVEMPDHNYRRPSVIRIGFGIQQFHCIEPRQGNQAPKCDASLTI